MPNAITDEEDPFFFDKESVSYKDSLLPVELKDIQEDSYNSMLDEISMATAHLGSPKRSSVPKVRMMEVWAR